MILMMLMAGGLLAQTPTPNVQTKCSPTVTAEGQIEFVCTAPAPPPVVVSGDKPPLVCWTETGPAPRMLVIQPEKGLEMSLLVKPAAGNEWKIPMGYGIPAKFLNKAEFLALPPDQRWAMLRSATMSWSIYMVTGACASAILDRLSEPL